ncbi:MAG: site-specific integrase, partial [Verrucomicrobiaceae bacterium]
KRDEAIAEYNRTLGLAPAEGYTVKTWGQYCLEEVWPQELREGTLEDYENALRVHIYPVFGYVNLGDVRAQEVQRFFNRLGEKLTRQSVLKVRTVFSSLMTRAVVNDLITGNPVRDVKVKAAPFDPDAKADKRILTAEESTALLNHTSATYIHSAALLALKMGLRAGECLGLLWRDVDFDRGTITVRRQLQRVVGKGLVVTPPKTSHSNRTLKMPPAVREHLLAERQSTKSLYVVANGLGKPLEQSRLRQMFNNCAWSAGLMTTTDEDGAPLIKPTFHDLRSTFLSHAAERGANPRQLMELAGHSTPATTLAHYVRANTAGLDALMESA